MQTARNIVREREEC